ncbi:MAG: hypothetical protein KAH95_11910 [Spirochaetales bacterium]|nr:hypothetical protein [Desulfobacterales bacterium]MCK5674075.1 hypothetical protein [Spirochaetales bacterium]
MLSNFDMRTPLNGVAGMLDLVSGTHINDEQRDFFNFCLTKYRFFFAAGMDGYVAKPIKIDGFIKFGKFSK